MKSAYYFNLFCSCFILTVSTGDVAGEPSFPKQPNFPIDDVTERCQCEDPSWCDPVRIPLYSRKEVYGFSLKTTNWYQYDWSVITAMAWFDKISSLPREMICWAHRHDARVVFTTSIPKRLLQNTTSRIQQKLWAKNIAIQLDTVGGDGLNLDFEDSVDPHDRQKQESLVHITQELQLQLKRRNPYSSLVWDFGWKPNVDVRFYSYQRLADNCDFIFVMVYDTQSQVWNGPPCIADANSPVTAVRQSLLWYGPGNQIGNRTIPSDDEGSLKENALSLNIPYEKILLGVPWYGYYYNCIIFDHSTQQCTIAAVPFRGAPCSDAAGKQIDYPFTLAALEYGGVQGILDTKTISMRAFVHSNDDGASKGNTTVAYYYDSPETIRYKIAVAWQLTSGQLGGVGMWNADVPNYTDVEQSQAFWDAMTVPHPSHLLVKETAYL